MALDFPNSPTIGQIFIGPNSIAWSWDGAKWGQVGVATTPSPHSVSINGRLTLTSGVPVLTADVSAATAIYFTPYLGNRLWIPDASQILQPYLFSELSLGLNTSAHVANTNYDLFVWNNAGTLQLVSGPAWSSGTVRAAAISLLNGIYVNTAVMAGIASGNTGVSVPAQQGLYVGTFRTIVTAGQTAMAMNPAPASGGSLPQLLLWNNYNRRLQSVTNSDNGASYTYTSATVRQARGSANNQINFVTGLAEDAIIAQRFFHQATVAIATANTFNTVGLDVVTLASNNSMILGAYAGTAVLSYGYLTLSAMFDKQLGYHFLTSLEAGDGAHANTFDLNSTDTLQSQHWC